MQAIQVQTGKDDAWAGFAVNYVEKLRDEFGKLGVWVWGIGDEQGKVQRAKQLLKSTNEARMLSEMSMHASMYVPLSLPTKGLPPYVQLDRGSRWHTSALLSAAFESITLPSRQRSRTHGQAYLDQVEAGLNTNGNQRIARLQASVLASDSLMEQGQRRSNSDDAKIPTFGDTPMKEDFARDCSTDLDVDLLTDLSNTSLVGSSQSHDNVFGGIECFRGRLFDHDDAPSQFNRSKAAADGRTAGFPAVTR